MEVSNEEHAIILEILKKEAAKIPVEIHHCGTNDFKIFLKDKLSKIEALIKKFE